MRLQISDTTLEPGDRPHRWAGDSEFDRRGTCFPQGAQLTRHAGTLFVTNQRVVFQGSRQTRECRYDKMVAIHHTEDGATVFSVSNRQKPTIVAYGTEIAGWFEFRLELALAHDQNDVPALVHQLQEHLAAVDATKPLPPELPAAEPASGSEHS